MSIERFLGLPQFKDARKNGGGWMARCPAHDDRNPSLSIAEGEDGRVLLKCFAGCSTPAVCTALGITGLDLFEGPLPSRTHRKERRTESPAKPSAVKRYEIRDPDRVLVAVHVRSDFTDAPKKFHWEQPNGALGLNGTGTADLPLYGAERLANRDPKATVIVTEGEKAADAADKLFPAVGTVTGASGCPNETALEILRGRDVLLWADADDPGLKHMQRLGQRLDGIAERVLLFMWGERGSGADAADFVEAGWTADQLDELVKDEAESWEPSAEAEPAAEAHAGEMDGEAHAVEDWPAPQPLRSVDVPPFPLEALPDVLRTYVEAVSLETQTPADLAAFVVLAVLATATAKRVVVEVRYGWREPVNLFVAVVLGPGNRKSAVFRECTAPLKKFETDEAHRLGDEARRSSSRRKVAEKALEQAQVQAAKALEGEKAEKLADVDRAVAELAALPVVTLPRLSADDVTPEKLADLMAANGERMAVLSAEGGIFGILAGRYTASGGPNLDVFLKGHAGDAVAVDRMSREPVRLQAPALTVGLTLQPDVLRACEATPEFRGRGLLARFLFALPVSCVGSRPSDAPAVPGAVRRHYAETVAGLLALEAAQDEDGNPVPHVLKLTQVVAAAHRTFREWLEPQLGEAGELALMVDWAAKLAGAVARIAGLLHLAEHAAAREPWAVPVSAETMTRAVALGRYLIPHARAAFSEMGADPVREGAEHILVWLRRTRPTTFTRRELFNGTRRRFERVEKVDPPLELLEDHGFIRALPPPVSTGGRPASQGYEVNPATCPQKPQYTQKSPPDQTSAASAASAVPGGPPDSRAEEPPDPATCPHNPHNYPPAEELIP